MNLLSDSEIQALVKEHQSADPERQQQIANQFAQDKQLRDYTAGLESAKSMFDRPEDLGGQWDDSQREATRLLGEDEESAKKRFANTAFIAAAKGLPRDQVANVYEPMRDAFASEQFGKPTVTDEEFHSLVDGRFKLEDKKNEAVRALTVATVAQAIEDAKTGIRTPGTTPWQKVRAQYPDLFDGKDDSKFWARAMDSYTATSKDLPRLAGTVGKGLDLLQKFTKGDAGGDGLSNQAGLRNFAADLAALPPEDRKKAVDYIAVAAEAHKIDRNAFAQFALNVGQSISRGVNFVNSQVLMDQQLGVANELDAINKGIQVWVPNHPKQPTSKGNLRQTLGLPDRPGVTPEWSSQIEGTTDLSRAVYGNASPEATKEAEAENSPWRLATPDEREALKKQKLLELDKFKAVRDLRDVADTAIDPVKRIAKPGTFMGDIEGAVYGVGGSLGYLAAGALNPALSLVAYRATEFDRIMQENPDMNPVAAQNVASIEGAWQAALDQLQLKMLTGKLPVTGKLLAKIQSKGLRRTLGYVASSGEQFGQELAQDIGTMGIDAIAAALREDMADKDFAKDMGDYRQQAPEVLVASILFGLIGGHAASSSEVKVTDHMARIVGISEKNRERIQLASTPAERDALIAKGLEERTKADIEQGIAFARTELQKAQQAQADPARPTLEIKTQPDGTNLYQVLHPDGSTLLETKDAETANAAIQDFQVSSMANELSSIKDLFEVYLSKDPNMVLKEGAKLSVREQLDALEGLGNKEGIERLWQRIRAEGLENADLDQVHILGETTVDEIAEGVYRTTVMLRNGARPETAWEELNHGFVRKSLQAGRVTLDQLGSWLEQTSKATGIDYTRGNEIEIIESVAKAGLDLAYGRIEESQMPQSLIDYVRGMLRIMKEAMVRALKFKEASEQGLIPADFESYLSESMGLPTQGTVDMNRDITALKLASNAQTGSITGALAGEGGVLSGPIDYDIRITAAPLRFDNLSEFTQDQVDLRATAAPFLQLQQVFTDTLKAFGVDIASREAVIGGWSEQDRLSTEVPEAVTAKINDMALAREMAAVVAASAPDVQNAAMVWRVDPNGQSKAYQFNASSAEAALSIAKTLHKVGYNGFSYNTTTNTFTIVSVEIDATLEKDLYEYIEHESRAGIIAPSEKTGRLIEESRGEVSFPHEGEYSQLLESALKRADRLGGERGAAIRDVVSAAAAKLEAYRAAKNSESGTADLSIGRARVETALADALNRSPGERLGMYHKAKLLFNDIAERRAAMAKPLAGKARQASIDAAKAKHEQTVAALDAEKARNLEGLTDKARVNQVNFSHNAKRKAADNLLQREIANATGAADKYPKMLQSLWELDAILRVLPPEVRGKVGGYTTLANLGKDTNTGSSTQTVDAFLEKRIAMIGRELERVLKHEYGLAFKRFIETTKPKKAAPGEKPKGIGADVQVIFNSVQNAMDMDAPEVAALLAGIDAQLATGVLTPQEEAFKQIEASLVALVGDWQHADSERRATALAEARKVWTGAYLDHVAKITAQREERDATRSRYIQATGKQGTTAEIKAKAIEDNGFTGTWKDNFLSLLNFEQLSGFLFGDNSAEANALADAQREAENLKEDGTQAKMDEIEEFFTSMAGSRFAGEKLRHELAQPSITVDGIRLSQLEALTATMMWMQEDGQRHMLGKLDDNGKPVGDWHYNQGFIDHLERLLSPEALNLRSFLLEKYRTEYHAINKVYSQLNGVNLPQIRNYSPITVRPVQAPSGQVLDPVTGSAMAGAGITPGALRNRGLAVAAPQFRDALQTYIAHTKQMEHWKAFAPFALDANAILKNRDVQNAMEAKGGAEAMRVMNSWLDYFAQGGTRDAGAHLALNKGFNTVLSRFSQIAIVGRISTLLVQATQMGAALAEIPTGAYIKRMAKLMTGQLGWKAALESPYIQRRIATMPPVVRMAMEGLNADKPSQIQRAVQKLGTLISGADGLFTAGTYAIIYDYQLQKAKELGLTGEAAETHARRAAERITDRVAQPTRSGARSLFENTSTAPMARAAWAFASEGRKNLALLAYNLAKRDTSTKLRSAAYVVLINSLGAAILRGILKDALDSEDDELFDEKHWDPKRIALVASTEWLYGLPVVGASAQESVYAAFGERNSQSSPFSVSRGIGPLKRIPEHLSGESDMEQVLKDVDSILSVLGLAHPTIAASASLSHLSKDLFSAGKSAVTAATEEQ